MRPNLLTKQFKYWNITSAGYDTVAVICKNVEDSNKLYEKLSKHLAVLTCDDENPSFTKGVTVLPIRMTKGLEFDAVVLYNPTEEDYPSTDENAKLLYVAATRALHELHVIYRGELSKLLISYDSNLHYCFCKEVSN